MGNATVQTFVRKPEKVRAIRYDGKNVDAVINFVGATMHEFVRRHGEEYLVLQAENMVPPTKVAVSIGDYVVEVPNGVFMVYGAGLFESIYVFA